MSEIQMYPALVAIDLGAESCRVSLLNWNKGEPAISVVHRFANAPVRRSTGLHWALQSILDEINFGLQKCGAVTDAPIAAIGVDGWAVDYVRLRRDRVPLADPYCYRDRRTIEAEQQVHRMIKPEDLYRLTGIQILRLNTVYQLFADNRDQVNQGAPWVNLPEFVSHYLGGERVSEYTNATHTGLVRLGSHEWCSEIFNALHLDQSAAPPLVRTGTQIGKLRQTDLCAAALQNTALVVPACHDTAAAIAGIPAQGDDWAFISSGTWSLVGTTLSRPCATDEARQKNFTNLGGAGNQTCFLKNVNGMWLLRQCMDEWQKSGTTTDLTNLLQECEALPPPRHLIQVDAPDLLLPDNIPAKINAQLTQAGAKPLPVGRDGMLPTVNVILHSLAARYAEVLRDSSAVTGKKFKRLYIVGGGSKNMLLNRLTAAATGLEVFAGPVECTTLGNFAIQLAALDARAGEAPGHQAIFHWASRLAQQQIVGDRHHLEVYAPIRSSRT